MTNLLKIPTWSDEQYIHAVVETPRGSSCKLDFDPDYPFETAEDIIVGFEVNPQLALLDRSIRRQKDGQTVPSPGWAGTIQSTA
jgi:inorganic pyrophosphatase